MISDAGVHVRRWMRGRLCHRTRQVPGGASAGRRPSESLPKWLRSGAAGFGSHRSGLADRPLPMADTGLADQQIGMRVPVQRLDGKKRSHDAHDRRRSPTGVCPVHGRRMRPFKRANGAGRPLWPNGAGVSARAEGRAWTHPRPRKTRAICCRSRLTAGIRFGSTCRGVLRIGGLLWIVASGIGAASSEVVGRAGDATELGRI